MSSVLASGTGSTSTTSAIITSSPIPSIDGPKHLNPIVIAIIAIGSITFGLLLVVVLIYAPTLCRSCRKQHPKDKYKSVDTVESGLGISVDSVSKLYRDDWHPNYEYGGTTLPLTTKHQQSFNHSTITDDSQYLEFANPWPSSHFVKEPEDRAIDGTDVTSGVRPQSLGDTKPLRGLEISALHSARPSSSNSTIKLTPLIIPEKPLNDSDGKRSIKRNGSTQSSTTLNSAVETEDSASLYSEVSASASIPYSSRSSLETVVPPPVPTIPPRFTTTHSTLPENVDIAVSARGREEAIIKPSPLFAPLPALRINRDDEEQDGAEIYNVAKLLHSRQSRVQTTANPPSRNSSIVSHIERSGSIRPVIPPPGESKSESYRPRYRRLKQNSNTRSSSYASSFSAPHPGEPFPLLPSSHLRDSSQVVGS